MEQKHTPGPWYAVPNNVFIDITTAPGSYGGETIADTCSNVIAVCSLGGARTFNNRRRG